MVNNEILLELLQTMEPTEPHRSMPMPGEPGSAEERNLFPLSSGMTLEGKHIVLITLDTFAVLPPLLLTLFLG